MASSVQLHHLSQSLRPSASTSGRARPAAAGRPLPAEQPARACRRCRRQQWRRAAGQLGGADDGSGEGEQSVDIDELAAFLGAEADRLRRQGGSFNGDDQADQPRPGSLSAAEQQQQQELLRPFGYEVKTGAEDILAAVGEGGFFPEEFELMQELGTINIQQVATSVDLDDFPIPTSERSARTAVIAYTASFFSGMPFQDPVVVLAKEYLPGAKAVACNELQVLKHLAGMPENTMKWQTAASPLASYPPIVRLLGYFLAGQTGKARSMLQGPVDPEDAIWIVLKWEGLAPLSLYPAAQQTSGIGLGSLFGRQDSSLRERQRMIRSITRGALRALAYCHELGVVHGSLGSGSLMLSSFDDRSAKRLVVKLDNFGFARKITVVPSSSRAAGGDPADPAEAASSALADDTPLALGQRDDLRALAVVLLECFLSALAVNGPSQLTTTESLQRLLGEVFVWNVEDFRQYCEDEPDWQPAVELLALDGGAGWQLLQYLVGGTMSAADLADSRFCQLGK